MTHAHIHQVYAKHEWVVRSEYVTCQPLYRYLSVGTLGDGGVRGGGVMKGTCRVSRGGGVSSLLYIMAHHILAIHLSVAIIAQSRRMHSSYSYSKVEAGAGG